MADNERNKFDVSTTYGDPSWSFAASMADEKNDFDRDGAGIPSTDAANNKFPVTTNYGDQDGSSFADVVDDNSKDFAQDSAGFNNPAQPTQTDWPLSFEPNKYPRQTGHDSMTEDDLYHT